MYAKPAMHYINKYFYFSNIRAKVYGIYARLIKK